MTVQDLKKVVTPSQKIRVIKLIPKSKLKETLFEDYSFLIEDDLYELNIYHLCNDLNSFITVYVEE